jgi:hypothetical protein
MQSKKHSLFESFVNVLVGLGIAIASQRIIFPLLGHNVPVYQNLILAIYFTIISIIRSYALRRVFNKKTG